MYCVLCTGFSIAIDFKRKKRCPFEGHLFAQHSWQHRIKKRYHCERMFSSIASDSFMYPYILIGKWNLFSWIVLCYPPYYKFLFCPLIYRCFCTQNFDALVRMSCFFFLGISLRLLNKYCKPINFCLQFIFVIFIETSHAQK